MKKGFTLVELLAVIVILGVLSVLTVPKIIKTLNDSEEKINLSSANELLKAAEYQYERNEITGINENLEINYTTGQNIDKLDFNGKKPEKGKIKITNEGNISIAVKIGNKCYIKEFGSKDITSQQYNEETCIASTSFAEDSWTTIKAKLTTNRNAYAIGDTKEVVIDNVPYTVRLANTSSCPNNWPEAASQTACGVVIEFIDTIKDSTNNNTDGHVMNPSTETYEYGTNIGGWPASSMRSYLNETIFNKLPEELKANGMILDTSVVSGHGSTEGETNFTSTDKLYLLSYVEVWGSNYSNDSVKLVDGTVTDGTRQLQYYGTTGSTRIKNTTEGSAKVWWLRSANPYYTYYFLFVRTGGSVSYSYANTTYGVAPAFRILN